MQACTIPALSPLTEKEDLPLFSGASEALRCSGLRAAGSELQLAKSSIEERLLGTERFLHLERTSVGLQGISETEKESPDSSFSLNIL